MALTVGTLEVCSISTILPYKPRYSLSSLHNVYYLFTCNLILNDMIVFIFGRKLGLEKPLTRFGNTGQRTSVASHKV